MFTAPKRYEPIGEPVRIVTPGEVITDDPQFMRGHGTYLQDDKLIASCAGIVERVNKLISVKPCKARYDGEVGDVVVGKIVDLGPKKWRVDICAKQFAQLALSAINLPGGVQRRKSESDELEMRNYLAEGDVICAEVQAQHQDGVIALHTRSSKYKKLKNGCLAKVPCVLVRRSKSHFITLSCGVEVILGLNGYIWICKHVPLDPELANQPEGIFSNENDEITFEDRECISRVYNIVVALGALFVPIHESMIADCYDISLEYPVKEILNPEIRRIIIGQAKYNIEQQ